MRPPLVSFIICTYNQERYIEDAIKGALDQIYHPLEIIISDDCSKDSTFTIIQKVISDYRGPHKIRVNRNAINLGIGRHWDYVSRMANGELIIHAAGDDISVPNRVTELTRAWSSLDPRPILITSNGMVMTEYGKDLYPLINLAESDNLLIQKTHKSYDFDSFDIFVPGFSLAIDKKLHEVFEPLRERMWSEDDILRSRALLIGSIAFLPKILVRYRQGGISTGAFPSQEDYLSRYNDQALSRINYLEQLKRDYRATGTNSDLFYSITEAKLNAARNRLTITNSNHFMSSLISLIILLVLPRQEFNSKVNYLKLFAVTWLPNLFFSLKRILSQINK